MMLREQVEQLVSGWGMVVDLRIAETRIKVLDDVENLVELERADASLLVEQAPPPKVVPPPPPKPKPERRKNPRIKVGPRKVPKAPKSPAKKK